MPGVVKKNKQKTVAKTSPAKENKKFISESLQNKKSKKGLQKKTAKHRRRGVVYIKHLPHGFYEEQLRGYFSQFGAITRLRLARSPKTLGSKGYAFIEFRYPEVAEIAADAMNNYLMFKNIIKTRYIPPNDIKHDYFRSSVKKVKKDGEKVLTSKTVEAREAVVLNTNKLMTEEDEKERTTKVGTKISKQKQKLAALGIDYDVDEVAQNLGEEVMSRVLTPTKTSVIPAVKTPISDADETLDSENLDIDSDDEFEDFDYGSEESDEEEEEEKIQVAVKKAQQAKKTAKIEEPKVTAQKKEKRKGNLENEETAEIPGKKMKKSGNEAPKKAAEPQKKVSEKKTVEIPKKVANPPKKAGKKGKSVPEETQETTPEVPEPVKRGRKTPVKSSETQEITLKQPAGKKSNKKQESQGQVRAAATGLIKPVKEPAEKPEPKGKGKKGKPAASASPPAKPEPKKSAKKPVQDSPQPAKTKKLAKASAGIEKKKPAAKTDNKKMKLAAKAATSDEGDAIVKVVKGKEIKGKKKAAKK